MEVVWKQMAAGGVAGGEEVAGGRWLEAGGRWLEGGDCKVAGGRVGGCRWAGRWLEEVVGGRHWRQVAGGRELEAGG